MKFKETVALVITQYDDEPQFLGYIPSADNDYYIVVDTKEIEVEFDDPTPIDIKHAKLNALNSEKQRIRATAQHNIERVDDKIQALMALEADNG